MVEICSSPSQLLQIHPLLENFCRIPARSPSDYDQCSASQVQSTRTRIGVMITPAPEKARIFFQRGM